MKETEQTLLDQIKDQVAKENGGWKSWEHISASRYKDELWNVVVDRYAEAKAKASCEATPVSAPSESQEEHAKLFAEWLRKNNWSAIPKSEQHWFNILSGEKLRTTNDLYSDFTRNP